MNKRGRAYVSSILGDYGLTGGGHVMSTTMVGVCGRRMEGGGRVVITIALDPDLLRGWFISGVWKYD